MTVVLTLAETKLSKVWGVNLSMSANNYLLLTQTKDGLFLLHDRDADSNKGGVVGQAVGLTAILKKARAYLNNNIVEYGLRISEDLEL